MSASQATFPHPSPTELEQDKAGGKRWAQNTQNRNRAPSTHRPPQPGPAPSPACGTYLDGGIRASSLRRPGHLDWAECPPSPGSLLAALEGRTFTPHPAMLPSYPLGQWAGCAP